MKFSALTLAAVLMMTLGVYAQDNTTDPAGNSTDPADPAGNTTDPSTDPTGNTTTPGDNTTSPDANNTTPGNNTGNTTDGAPKPTDSSAAFAIAAGSQGVVAAGVFAGLLAALV